MGIADYFFVLLSDAFHGIYNHQHYIGTVNSAKGTDDTVFFNQLLNFALAAHAGRINEQITLPFLYYRRVDGIPSGACLVADDGTLFPYQCIEDRRFANVGPANKGNLDFILIFFIQLRYSLLYSVHDGIQHIAQPQMIGCGNRNRFA